MSSAIATCAPGAKPARSIASTSVASACFVAREVGPPAAFVGDAEVRAARAHDEAGVAIDLGGPFERLGEARRRRADDHEVLDVDAPAGVRAAAEDLDLRQRQLGRGGAAQVLVQRHAARGGRRMRRGHRDRERRVGAQARLGRRAVELDQARVERRLVVGAQADAPRARSRLRHGRPPASRRGRRTRRRRRAAPALRAIPSTRRPERSRGRRRRRRARPRPRRSAGRGCPRRGARERRRWPRRCRAFRRGSRSSLRERSAPVAGDVRQSRRRSAQQGAGHAAAPARDRARRRRIRPATCRRCARAAGPAAAPRRVPRCARAAPSRRRSRYAPARAANAARKSLVAAGVQRHFSSRWLRQKARSNAGSPHQAHSASRRTGPVGPMRMFFGLTSPCTSAILLACVAATSRSSADARSAWRRAVASR